MKEPRTRLHVDSEDPQRFLEALRGLFGDVEVEEEDAELEPVMESDWYKEISPTVTPGKALHIYRTNQRLTLDKLAEKTGIDKGHLSAMEHDKRAIGVKVAKKLAPALQCDYRALL